jgi:hypothetical protein
MPPNARRVSFCFPSRALRGISIVADTEPAGTGTLPAEVSSLLLGDKSASAAAVDALQYEAIEGSCHLTFRAAVVKLAGMKLAGIGLATAFVAASGVAGVDGTRSCALSAAVCIVASYFYALIYQVRRQGWKGGPFELALLWPKEAGNSAAGTVPQKLFVQEQAVDGLRWPTQTQTDRPTPTAIIRPLRPSAW